MGLNFTDKRHTSAVFSVPVGSPANYASVAAMKARLQAINSSYFTTARLNAMNENDLTYALRLADDAAGV